jgi:hypothetical protein
LSEVSRLYMYKINYTFLTSVICQQVYTANFIIMQLKPSKTTCDCTLICLFVSHGISLPETGDQSVDCHSAGGTNGSRPSSRCGTIRQETRAVDEETGVDAVAR